VGNVEPLARTTDTPRFNFGIIEMSPERGLEQHVHEDEDGSFYILDGEMTFFGEEQALASPGTFLLVPPGTSHGFKNEGSVPARMLNIHAPPASTGAYRSDWLSASRARTYRFLKYLAIGRRVKPALP
jgi:mannose-6-phosphate isomerase-like protein (cupin superfamily)